MQEQQAAQVQGLALVQVQEQQAILSQAQETQAQAQELALVLVQEQQATLSQAQETQAQAQELALVLVQGHEEAQEEQEEQEEQEHVMLLRLRADVSYNEKDGSSEDETYEETYNEEAK